MSGQSITRLNLAGGTTINRAIGARKVRAAMTSVIDLSAREFAEGMSRALRDDFGNDPSMAKTIADLTGASLGAVRKWLAGENGPTGEYLLKLMSASDSVWTFVLAATNRDKHGEVMQDRIRRALAIMEGCEEP